MTPPRFATWLLENFSHPDTCEEVQGDLLELYAHWVETVGKRRADWRYSLSALKLLRPLAKSKSSQNYPSPFLLTPDMIRSYLTIARRQLWNNRLYTSLNVVGLAIGLSACWIIYRLVSYEFAFDQHHAHKERIYRVVTRFNQQGQQSAYAGVPLPMVPAVQTQVSGIEHVVPMRVQWMNYVDVSQPTGKPTRFREIERVVATSNNYFGLIHYQWLAGDAGQALARPAQVVLARSRAERYFPGLTPRQVLGKTLTYSDTLTVRVTGVVADPIQPSSFAGREFLSLSTLPDKAAVAGQWDNINADNQLFVWLTPNADAKRVEKQINDVTALHTEYVRPKNGVRERWHPLQPLPEIHFATDIAGSGRQANKSVLYGLMGLAGFILLLAGINYVNLSTALAPARAREIGIRKTLGSRRRTLIGQFLGETLAITMLALGVAFGLSWFFFTYFGDLLPTDTLTYVNWPLTIGFLVVLVVGVSLLAGLYPAWLTTRFQPVSVLRGSANLTISNGNRSLNLRKGLIVFQFMIAQVFIIGAWLVGQQLRYALEKDMGFSHNAVVLTRFAWAGTHNDDAVQKRQAFRQEIARVPGVAAVSLGNPPANQSFTSNELTLKQGKREVNLSMQFKYVDTNYVSLYKLPILAGRNLRPSDTLRDFVINETAVRELGFLRPQDAIGQFLYAGNTALPIVGVVRDFQIASVRDKIKPTALVAYQVYANQISIKLASNRPADWQTTLTSIGRIWTEFYPDEPFDYKFYDQTVAAFYEGERTMSRIINLATGVAILISCLGLFGLATLMAHQRTKEIGIRKVLGASVSGVVALLSKDFLKLVLLAIVIASPIAWYVMNQWLQEFTYKIEIEWWVFALAGLLAVGIALLTVSFQSVKVALTNPVKSLRSE